MIDEPERQLDLFDGPHVPRVRALWALCACDSEAALRSLESEGSDAAPLRELAAALADALAAVAARADDPAPEIRRRWGELAALARRCGGLAERDVEQLRRSFHARVLESLPEPLAPIWPDGTPSAWLVLRAGDAARALHRLDGALRIAPESAAVLVTLANALVATGRESLAADVYRDALYLRPDEVDAEDLEHPALRRLVAEDDAEPAWRLPRAVMEGALPLPAPGAVILGKRATDAFALLAAGDPSSRDPVERARIFYLGMILGAPGTGAADLGRIRRAMRAANAELFEVYMEGLRGR